MSSPLRRTSLYLLLALLLAPLASAEERAPLVVLDLASHGTGALEAQAATLGVVRGLRALEVFQVLSAEDVRQLLALERNRQLFGAEGSGNLQLSRALGAQHTVVGSLARTAGGLSLELRLLDVSGGSVVSQKTYGPVAGLEQLAPVLSGLAQALMAPLLRERQGSLLVQASEEGAEVLVDDALLGSTPLQAPLQLAQGVHRLVVRKDGFISQSVPVRIEPTQLARQQVTLLPSPDYAEAYRQRHGRLRIGAYLASGAAVGALAGAYLLDQKSSAPLYRDEFLPRQLALRGSVPEPGQLDAKAQAVYGACGQDEAACRTRLDALGSRLTRQQWGTAGLAVVGLGAGVTAAYLWLSGEDPNRYSGLVAGAGAGAGGPTFALGGSF
ncbi:MAG TPA: PEGA domain-containing protein [Aggregicoccus sp.]|nr:PEGA domain-containing protein [Aggregicoccus sp.]